MIRVRRREVDMRKKTDFTIVQLIGLYEISNQVVG